MRKITVFLALIIAFPLFGEAQNIFGLWSYIKMDSYKNDQLVYRTYNNYKCRGTIFFDENGNLTAKSFNDDCSFDEEIKGKFILTENQLSATYERNGKQETDISKVEFLNPKTMLLITVERNDTQVEKNIIYLERNYDGESVILSQNGTLKSESDNGNPLAQYYYGIQCLSNDDSIDKGKLLIQESANNGFGPAQYFLGYEHAIGGRYFSKDYETSLRWLVKSYKNHDLGAMTFLANKYLFGPGKTNIELSYKLLLKAAELNDPSAQFNLGQYLIEGIYSQGKEEEGRYWIEQSALQGFKMAEKYLEKLD